MGSDRNTFNCSIPVVGQFIDQHCRSKFMVTLTDRRQLRSSDLTREIAWAIHKTNQAFFGTAYRRHGKVFLATYTVHEKTLNDGLHAHLLVGVPDGALQLKPNQPGLSVPEHLVRAWSSVAPAYRRSEGQRWDPIWDLSGAFSYVQKGVRSATDIDTVDVMNTKFPTSYDCPPPAGG
ncbi:hypothetical protein [Phenylobacterium sp.]|uniref:hypothetical protein n=1 Tax=Phenylobacterium sp. TaxID=1871053 RepID=UPI0027163078|nr:hypothetical protein [Phenylobacterium sp.]MDO8379203.1 hypothetical protein [Phenylobacterium sp.]